MFFLLFFDTASELETPVAESLPQGKESYSHVPNKRGGQNKRVGSEKNS